MFEDIMFMELGFDRSRKEFQEALMSKGPEESFGERMRKLREAKGVSLETLSDDTGYPKDFLGDIEKGNIAPPVAVVLQLSRFFEVDMDKLKDKRNKKDARKRTASHKKRVASYAYTALTSPGEKHLRAYRVIIDPETEHEGVEYHHEGEEFIYVIKGSLKIQVGRTTKTLKQDSCISFDSSISHKLSNATREKAELLVVIYVP